jgi:uncharacterized protein DUF3786
VLTDMQRQAMAESSNPGEDKAWEILSALEPGEVCRAAAVSYDAASRRYTVRSFNMDFVVSLSDRTITSAARESELLLKRLSYFFRLSVLWYLVHAKDITCTGRPVKLEHIKGGDIFTRGSHVLPLEGIARKYAANREGFVQRGKSLGGELVKNGDASVRLAPLPRIPATLTLWLEDEEFPARVDLMFDSTCELQLPTDMIWSVAMMSVLVMT